MNSTARLRPDEVKSRLEHILSMERMDATPENLKLIFSFIDLTSLNTGDTRAAIKNMCLKVNGLRERFPGVPNVAALCIYPSLVPTVKENLNLPEVSIASVAAGFPSSQTFLEVKELESKMAVAAGANEIDIVISLGKYFDNDLDGMCGEITRIKKIIFPARLKVILETGLMEDPADIYRASMASLKAGADFIKTSTGKIQPAATLEAVLAMCFAIQDFHRNTGKKAGIKPAGGIGTGEQALSFASVVRSVLGQDWLDPEWFRIGASRLSNQVLSEIISLETGEKREIAYF
jgi:deoxyribose-phosphate aldolase